MLSGGRSKKRAEETNTESLPDELLIDILVRFPADFLHDRAKLVCRRWCHIIRSHVFIKTHFEQHSTYGLVLSLPYSNPRAIYVTASQGRIETAELSSRKITSTSCNGFALEYNGCSLHVTNPATKQSFLLPYFEHNRQFAYYHLSGIAYSAASMEYKVTLPYNDDRLQPTCLAIVTVGVDKSWRHVKIPPILEPFGSFFFSISPLSSQGFLQWGNWRYCLTLNVETEMITMTESPFPHPPPKCYDPYLYYYLSTGRYITLLTSYRKTLSWQVWEMWPAESGEWRKAVLANIDLEPQKCKLQRQFGYDDYNHYLKPVGWVKYPEVLALRFGISLGIYIFYNLETHEINERAIELVCDNYDHQYRALVHRDSLVWLAQD